MTAYSDTVTGSAGIDRVRPQAGSFVCNVPQVVRRYRKMPTAPTEQSLIRSRRSERAEFNMSPLRDVTLM